MATTLLGLSRRAAAHLLSSSRRCHVLRLVNQESIGRFLFPYGVACYMRSDRYRNLITSRHYSSSSPKSARHCKHEGCGLNANFGWADDGKALYCSFHKETSMKDVKNKRCEHPGCDRISPTFGYAAKKGVRCASHKLPGMVDVTHPRCDHEGCSLRPAFNTRVCKRGRFCEKHKEENMVDVAHRKCGHENCDLEPFFGFPVARERVATNLLLSGMRIQGYSKCESKGCRKRARFGVVLAEPFYCEKHKSPKMMDVVSNRCSQHKLEGMVNLDKRCEQDGCRKKAAFGFQGSTFQYCVSHKLDGMIQYKGRVEPT